MHPRAGDGAVISEQRLPPQTALVARRPDADAAPLTALSEATDGPGLSNVLALQLRATDFPSQLNGCRDSWKRLLGARQFEPLATLLTRDDGYPRLVVRGVVGGTAARAQRQDHRWLTLLQWVQPQPCCNAA